MCASIGQATARFADARWRFALAGRLYARPVELEEAFSWQCVLDRLGLPGKIGIEVARRSIRNMTPFQAECIAARAVPEERFCESLALELGLSYASTIQPSEIDGRDEDCLALLARRPGTAPARIRGKDLTTLVAVSTDRLRIVPLKRFLEERPDVRQKLRVVPPVAMRRALLGRCRKALGESATASLFSARPDLSARFVLSGWQGCVLTGIGLCGALLFAYAPLLGWLGLHLAASLFFLSCIWLRAAALGRAGRQLPPHLEPVDPAELPVYSVLVALHREAEVVPQLIEALNAIKWPRAKLEVKLVCEADDQATLEALARQKLPPWFEIIEVPAGVGPRTKPKALAYALPTTSGEFVVLYDAEDRPHPGQLLEAWQTFKTAPPTLACLQAPLEIINADHNLITHAFGLEYSALFRGLLPHLSSTVGLLPLGGTSNHFRRSILEEVGGWDPYNVTEDADLGVRLCRFGYRTGTIALPTLEPASDRWSIWLPQRTRWFKGWCQTSLKDVKPLKIHEKE